jgi:hypothetical protein
MIEDMFIAYFVHYYHFYLSVFIVLLLFLHILSLSSLLQKQGNIVNVVKLSLYSKIVVFWDVCSRTILAGWL